VRNGASRFEPKKQGKMGMGGGARARHRVIGKGEGGGSGARQLVEVAVRRTGVCGGGPVREEVACGPCLELAAGPLPWVRLR
jgi:hypothetical protein